MIARLASASYTHRTRVLAVWVLIVIGGAATAPVLFGRLTSDAGNTPGSEADRAASALYRAAPSGKEIYAVADGRSAAELRAPVERAAAGVAALPGVLGVHTPWSDSTPDPSSIARDGRAVALVVRFAPTEQGDAAVSTAAALLRAIDAPHVVVGGGALQDDEMNNQAGADLARAELLSMPIVGVLLLVLFRGFVAAGLPVLVSLAGIGATLGGLTAASMLTDVSVYTVNIVTMLGLGLAVDYALLIVSRLREERHREPDLAAAVRATYATAGRTVAFSGLTVAASLAGLLAFSDAFLRSMGLAALCVVLLDMAAAVTLLPALLSVAGRRIRPVAPAGEHGVFAWIARAVGRRPIVIAVVCAGLLLAAAAPFTTARWADADARSLPTSAPSRQLADLAAQRFRATASVDPITVVLTGRVDVGRYRQELAALHGVESVTVRDGVPGLTVLDVHPSGTSQGSVAMRLVGQVRALPAPAPKLVGGDAAQLADYQHSLGARLPWALGITVLMTFVLLFLFTGSVVVPVKALILNTLSLGATFGALVWVFQDGHLGSLVGTQALGSLSVSTPVIVVAIAFGLSMDYEVFLLGRISEVWRRTGDNRAAVAIGLQRTGRIVTAAALLMVVVFAGFVAGGFSPVKQVGLGLVVAIAVDATIVRMLLLPAVMGLMGRGNWWAPRRLERIRVHESVRV